MVLEGSPLHGAGIDVVEVVGAPRTDVVVGGLVETVRSATVVVVLGTVVVVLGTVVLDGWVVVVTDRTGVVPDKDGFPPEQALVTRSTATPNTGTSDRSGFFRTFVFRSLVPPTGYEISCGYGFGPCLRSQATHLQGSSFRRVGALGCLSAESPAKD
jgi:hypothetical protein